MEEDTKPKKRTKKPKATEEQEETPMLPGQRYAVPNKVYNDTERPMQNILRDTHRVKTRECYCQEMVYRAWDTGEISSRGFSRH